MCHFGTGIHITTFKMAPTMVPSVADGLLRLYRCFHVVGCLCSFLAFIKQEMRAISDSWSQLDDRSRSRCTINTNHRQINDVIEQRKCLHSRRSGRDHLLMVCLSLFLCRNGGAQLQTCCSPGSRTESQFRFAQMGLVAT